MVTILNNMSKKGLQKKNQHIIICNYCLNIMPIKHKIECSDCGNNFCKNCLTILGNDKLCNECLIYFMRNKVRMVITK